MISSPLVLALLLLAGSPRVPDQVELADGTKLEGRIVFEDEELLVVRVGTRDREIEKQKVVRSTSRAVAHREAIETWIGLGPRDVTGLLALAESSKRDDLLEEAHLFALQVLLIDPANAAARELCGHEAARGSWLVREGGRKVEWTKLLKSHQDFGDPWELETTHYRVRTNLPLPQALEVAFSLECHYLAFRDAFGRDLRLLEVVEPLTASVHADSKSFPEVTSGRKAHFAPASRTLFVDANAGLDVRTLVHEATHATLFGSALADTLGRADVPAWLDEGLAVYMETAVQGSGGKLFHGRQGSDRSWYRRHAEEKDPYDLSRVLNFETADFLASSRADLKYAQAYTLVDFLAHGEDGKYREGFARFVKSAFVGKSSQTHFKAAIGVDDKVLERAWKAFVGSSAK